MEFESEPVITSALLLIAVQDDLILPVAERAARWPGSHRIVMHVSGAESSDALSPFGRVGKSLGSFHPLISVADAASGAERLLGAGFCFEGDDDAREYAEALASDLRGRMFSIPASAKASYHAAAVTACGHFVALVDCAVELLGNAGIPRDDGLQLLLPLIESTLANLRRGTAESALTGPFRRGDETTVDRHLEAISAGSTPELLAIYKMLGARSLEIAERGGLNPTSADQIRRKISLAK